MTITKYNTHKNRDLDHLNTQVKKVLAFSLDFLVVEVTEVSTACHGAQTTLSVLGKDLDSLDGVYFFFACHGAQTTDLNSLDGVCVYVYILHLPLLDGYI